MAITARVVNNTSGVSNVKITSPVRTVVVDPSYKPKLNVSINEIIGLNTVGKKEGDVLVYSANTDTFISGELGLASINIAYLRGGTF
jgi:hypothetical protein